MTIMLNGSDLTVTQVVAVARHGADAKLDPQAIETMRQARAVVQDALSRGLPVSFELASSAKGESIEDRATMAPLSARRLAEMTALCARVAAIEMVVAAQAIDLRELARPDALGQGTGRAYRTVRDLVPFTQADGTLPADLEPLVELIARGDLEPGGP